MAIYLDYAATVPMPAEVLAVYTDALAVVGNPSSIHSFGQSARQMVEEAREAIARVNVKVVAKLLRARSALSSVHGTPTPTATAQAEAPSAAVTRTASLTTPGGVASG